MSKTPSPALFELIQNMTKSEKRYFKIRSAQHTIGTENKYVQLFDFIDQQKSYAEEELFEHFKGENFLNKFSITKNRLYDQIMKALDSYHSGGSTEASIYKLLHGTKILYEKGLYEHALRQLKSAKRLVEKHENTEVRLIINNLHYKIIETQGYQKIEPNDIDQLKKEEDQIIRAQSYYNNLWFLKSKLMLLIQKQGKSRSQQDVDKYRLIWEEYQQLITPEKRSFRSEYLKNHFESAYYFAILEDQKSLDCLRLNLGLMQKDEKRIKKEPEKYLSLLTNIIHHELAYGNRKQLLSLLGELNAFQHRLKIEMNEDIAIKLFSSVNSTKLLVFLHQAEFTKATELEETIIQGFQDFGKSITASHKAYLSFNLAIAFFGTEDYKKTLKWINAILNNTQLDENEDIVAFAHIVGLITHFELNNQEYLPYALKNTLRFLEKRNKSYAFEKLFLKYLRKIIVSKDSFAVEEILKDATHEIESFTQNPFDSVAFEYFDFKSWLISKIKGKKFQVIKRDAYLSASA